MDTIVHRPRGQEPSLACPPPVWGDPTGLMEPGLPDISACIVGEWRSSDVRRALVSVSSLADEIVFATGAPVCGDRACLRNLALENASGEWRLLLEPGEVLALTAAPSDVKRFLKGLPPEAHAVCLALADSPDRPAPARLFRRGRVRFAGPGAGRPLYDGPAPLAPWLAIARPGRWRGVPLAGAA